MNKKYIVSVHVELEVTAPSLFHALDKAKDGGGRIVREHWDGWNPEEPISQSEPGHFDEH